jgi:hypothetical protein
MHKIIILFFLISSLSSCYVYKTKHMGNILDQFIGRSKNEILMEFGPPDRISDDGNGGSIMSYETNISEQIELSKYNTSIRDRTSITNDVNAINVQSRTSANTQGSRNTFSVNHKKYKYIFLDKNGKMYTYKTNTGDIFLEETCYDRKKSTKWAYISIVGLVFFPLWPIIAIPYTIYCNKKANKIGNNCN